MRDRRKHYKRGPEASSETAGRQHAFCVKLIEKMLKNEDCQPFSKPVTELWDIQELPGYFDVVESPMDLGTILEHLHAGAAEYTNDKTGLFDYRKFIDAVYLVFENCQKYNDPGSDFHDLAETLMSDFDLEMRAVPRHKADPSGSGGGGGSGGSGGDADADEEQEEEDESPGGDADDDSPEVLAAQEALDELEAKRAEAQKVVEEVDRERSRERTEKERQQLRDVIESAPWEEVDKVVKLLRTYVDKALDQMKQEDPEFVTIEMNAIEPQLLAQVENVVKPDPKREEALKTIKALDGQVEGAQNKLKSLKRRSVASSGERKKAKKRR